MNTRVEFGGRPPEPAVGEILALRSFQVTDDGDLYPVILRDKGPWDDGENRSACTQGFMHRAVGFERCLCGFYAYSNDRWAHEYPSFQLVRAVVACYGTVTLGTKGLRCTHSQIDAVWLSRRVPDEVAERVATTYPQVQVYRDYQQMLEEHPLTDLPDYQTVNPVRAAARRRWDTYMRPMIPGLVVGAMIAVAWVASNRHFGLDLVAPIAFMIGVVLNQVGSLLIARHITRPYVVPGVVSLRALASPTWERQDAGSQRGPVQVLEGSSGTVQVMRHCSWTTILTVTDMVTWWRWGRRWGRARALVFTHVFTHVGANVPELEVPTTVTYRPSLFSTARTSFPLPLHLVQSITGLPLAEHPDPTDTEGDRG